MGLGLLAVAAGGLAAGRHEVLEKRVRVVEEGGLVRGAWQRPGPLRRIIRRQRIKTIVTLTAINRDDPKYLDQEKVVRQAGTGWIIVPMRGSRATLEQMAEAADLLADPARRPVFFHCVAGHHRTSLVHAAYRIRHEGWSAERAWREVAGLPWARPRADIGDRRLIEAFAARERRLNRPGEDSDDATSRNSKVGRAGVGGGPGSRAGLPGLEPGRGQLRDRPDGPGVSLRTDERGGD